ncbi:SRPBCC family protein [Thermocatellispora tengchongensis]|nr:SRPBCC family protein [Thermocatellispora tengchongensis]
MVAQPTEQAERVTEQAERVTEKAPLPKLPTDRLAHEAQNLLAAVGERMLSRAADKVTGLTGRLTDYVENEGTGLVSAMTGGQGGAKGAVLGGLVGGVTGGIKGAVKGLFRGKGGKGGKTGPHKVTNIVESIDIGAPVHVVYNRWTRFEDFPTFMKKVEHVKQETDETLNWKAQVFWSHRTWKAKIVEQVPDKRIVWRSEGPKGSVDGAVTFHALAPDLTRVLVVLEYHPQGLFERTGNLWRAQGRRVRLELKHFRRHVMSELLPRLDEVEDDGWRGEIHGGQVVPAEEAEKGAEEAEEAPEEAEAEEAEAEEPEAAEEAEEEEPEEEYEEEEEEEEEAPVRGGGAPEGRPAREARERPVRRRREPAVVRTRGRGRPGT